MQSEILVAVCSLVGTAMGTYSGIRLMSYRIEQLEKKVEKHNGVIERMAVAENKIRVSEHRIDLERRTEKNEKCTC